MIVAANCYDEMINATARSIKARVELFDGETLLDTYTYDGALQSFVVERVGDSNKFFGYGICQKLTVKLRDRERAIHITKGQGMEVVVGVGCEYLYTCPIFFVEEIKRDENTNDLTITAYDAIYRAANHVVSEIVVPTPYTVLGFANAAAAVLGMPVKIERRNLLDMNKCEFARCTLNADGSLTSDINGYYYSSIYTEQFNDLLMNSKGKSFTLSTGVVVLDRYCTIVIHGTRSNGAAYQESNALSDRTTIKVADDFTSITNVELRFNRSLNAFTDTTTTIPYMQFEEGFEATRYDRYNPTFDVIYTSGANFEGKETIREALDDIAEATGTIYYMNNNWELTFKSLQADALPVLHIDRSKYYTLSSETSFSLDSVVSVTELGDNIAASNGNAGETQYIRDNPFWDLRDDVGDLLNGVFSVVGGLTITQFNCKWRGNFLLEVGDKISLVTKDDTVITSYVLNDTITYNGGLIGNTQWSYTTKQNETPSNPVTLGETIKQTYARVDKTNQRIDLVASSVTKNDTDISSLQVATNNISATVERTSTDLSAAMESMNDEVVSLTKTVNAKMSAEDVRFEISNAMNTGVSAVTTTTGFTFNEDGMRVSKTNSPMSTIIDEDGMTVFRDYTKVLECDSTGVAARNLHADTYLIIGLHSRFENYGEGRTGCFWVSGGGK